MRQVIEGSTNNLEEEGRVTSVAAFLSPDNPFLKETCFSGYLREDVLSQVASKLFETMEEGFDEFDWLRYFDGRGIRIKSPTVF